MKDNSKNIIKFKKTISYLLSISTLLSSNSIKAKDDSDINEYASYSYSEEYETIPLEIYDIENLEIFNQNIEYTNLAKHDIKNICESNDFQNVFSSELWVINYVINKIKEKENKYNFHNKNLKEIYIDYLYYNNIDINNIEDITNINNKDYLVGKLYDFITKIGYGNMIIVDIIDNKNTGLNCTVLKDNCNNYRIYFDCTNTNDINDIYYNIYNIYHYRNDNGIIANITKDTYINQINEAYTITGKYYKLSKEYNSRLEIQGFSLGGSIAEAVYYKYYNEDISGKLILYNPLHNGTLYEDFDEFIEELNNDGKLSLFCNNGDIVHRMNHTRLIRITKYLDINFNKRINKLKETINNAVYNNQEINNYFLSQIYNNLCNIVNNIKNTISNNEILSKLEILDINGFISNIVNYIKNIIISFILRTSVFFSDIHSSNIITTLIYMVTIKIII